MSMSGHARTVLLTTLLVLVAATAAGCSTLSSPPTDDSETVTAAPVPTDSGAEAEGRTLLPDGVTDDRLENPSLLADSHRQQLRNRSFVRIERREKTVYSNGSLVRQVTRIERIWIGPDGDYRHDVSRRVRSVRGVQWYNRSRYAGERWYLMVESEGDRQVVGGGDADSQWQDVTSSAVVISKYLSMANSSVRPLEGGQYLIRGNGSTHPEFTFAERYTVRAVVEPTGLIRRLSASYNESLGARTKTVTYGFAVRRVGNASVARPAWVPENGTVPTVTPASVTTLERPSNGTTVDAKDQ